MRGRDVHTFGDTNPLNTGLISADRSNTATLLLTIPGVLKSYARDLHPAGYFHLQDSNTRSHFHKRAGTVTLVLVWFRATVGLCRHCFCSTTTARPFSF